MAKTAPLTLRLPKQTEELIAAEASRSRRSRSAVVVELAEEALRTRIFPGIAFRGDAPRRAWLIGTGFDVWQVIEAWRDLGSVEELTRDDGLDERHVRLALAYYERFGAEIDELIAENRMPLSDLRRHYPHIDVIEVGKDG